MLLLPNAKIILNAVDDALIRFNRIMLIITLYKKQSSLPELKTDYLTALEKAGILIADPYTSSALVYLQNLKSEVFKEYQFYEKLAQRQEYCHRSPEATDLEKQEFINIVNVIIHENNKKQQAIKIAERQKERHLWRKADIEAEKQRKKNEIEAEKQRKKNEKKYPLTEEQKKVLAEERKKERIELRKSARIEQRRLEREKIKFLEREKNKELNKIKRQKEKYEREQHTKYLQEIETVKRHLLATPSLSSTAFKIIATIKSSK